MSETSARASLFARSPGSRARNGFIGRLSPAEGVDAAADDAFAAGVEGAATGGTLGGVNGGTETGAGGVAGIAAAGCHGVRGVVRSGGNDAPSAGEGIIGAVIRWFTGGVGTLGTATGVGTPG